MSNSIPAFEMRNVTKRFPGLSKEPGSEVVAVDAGDGSILWATEVDGDPLGGTTVVGDLVLTATGERLRNVLRPHDHIGQLASDEFAVVCTRMRGGDGALVRRPGPRSTGHRPGRREQARRHPGGRGDDRAPGVDPSPGPDVDLRRGGGLPGKCPARREAPKDRGAWAPARCGIQTP